MPDYHNYPILIKKHASEMLGDRFGLYDTDEIRHYIKNARVIEQFGRKVA